MTWSTSDASVATVDEHGVVTGIQGGTATITATSVDTNDGGEHVTASCAVTVKSLGDLSAKVNAQVVTEDGAKWVTIDTASRAVTVNGDAGTALTAAGAHEGKLYGTDNNYPFTADNLYAICNIYEIDPDQDYQETILYHCYQQYVPVDLTTAPKATVTLTDDDGNQVTKEAFGMPLYTNWSTLVTFLDPNWGMKDRAKGWNWGLYGKYESQCAIAYVGDSTINSEGEIHPSKVFYALGVGGTLYRFHMWAHYNAERPDGVDYC